MFLEDKRLNPGVEAKPFTLEHLIAWLERQEPEAVYNYNSDDNCLFDQYVRSFSNQPYGYNRACERFNVHVRVVVSVHTPWTFGAALERARGLL